MEIDIIKTAYDKLRATSDCHRAEKLKQGREGVSRYAHIDIHLERTNISQENRKNREIKWEKHNNSNPIIYIYILPYEIKRDCILMLYNCRGTQKNSLCVSSNEDNKYSLELIVCNLLHN